LLQEYENQLGKYCGYLKNGIYSFLAKNHFNENAVWEGA
jgi:hypothetical protein